MRASHLQNRYMDPSLMVEETAARMLEGLNAGESGEALAEELREIARLHSCWASLTNFARFFLKIPPNPARLKAWLEMYRKHEAAAAASFAAHLEKFDSILVHAGTHLLRLSLLGAGRPLNVFCTESRPSLEGKAFAESIADSRHNVFLICDLAAFSVVNRIDCAAFGCCALTPRGAVNRTGTAAICAAARAAGKKTYLAATTDARLEDWSDEHLLEQRPASELYAGNKKLRVENYCMEVTPFERFDGLFLETGPAAEYR